MRFLLEFVACCGSPIQKEEKSLVPANTPVAPITRCYRKKQRMSATEWRPSLVPISEDLPRESPRSSSAGSTRADAKKRTAGGCHGKVRLRSYSDSSYGLINFIFGLTFRSPSMPALIPTFSPTPFMF
ncbi:hypothetical protein Fmac_021353 [Flemingia macrophylla]|uniref:Uncharacterized protein n=1 Tax=Flemingia macrophylla TaxID=520843 RepID=A0ABD1LWL4_9FABA